MQLVVGLDDDAAWEPVADALRAAGATRLRPPSASLPGVLLAAFPDGPLDVLLAQLTRLDGVRYAESDTLSGP